MDEAQDKWHEVNCSPDILANKTHVMPIEESATIDGKDSVEIAKASYLSKS